MSNKKLPLFAQFGQHIGIGFLLVWGAMRLYAHYFGAELPARGAAVLDIVSYVALAGGIFFVIPYGYIRRNYFFDNAEYRSNTTREALVQRLRLRALLMHNFSAAVLGVTVLVIIGGMYAFTSLLGQAVGDASAELIVRSAAIVLLIFLVQVLFRVFKYLLRVGSFYHGIADVLELHKVIAYEEAGAKGEVPEGRPPMPPTTTDLDKLFERMVPAAYDISDVEASSILGTIKDLVKK